MFECLLLCALRVMLNEDSGFAALYSQGDA